MIRIQNVINRWKRFTIFLLLASGILISLKFPSQLSYNIEVGETDKQSNQIHAKPQFSTDELDTLTNQQNYFDYPDGYIANFSLVETARSTHIDDELGLIGVANKNGFLNAEEIVVYKIGNYTAPFKNLPLESGDMVLDYAWNYPYLALCSNNASEGLQIFNISDLEGSWGKLKSFDLGTKSHCSEWTTDGQYLIAEYLDETLYPHYATIVVIDATSSNVAQWDIARNFNIRFGTDIFQMEVSENYLTFQSNQHNYKDYCVHVWNISDYNPNNWYELYHLNDNFGGDISPDEKYIITTDDQNQVLLRYADNGSLFRIEESYGKNFQFTSSSSDLNGSIFGVDDNFIYKIYLSNFTEYICENPLDGGWHISVANDSHTIYVSEGTIPALQNTVGVFNGDLLPYTLSTNSIPVANFATNATTILEGESIAFSFNGECGNEPTEFEWDFGDDSINSTLINPIHQFDYSGNFTTSLMITDWDGQHSLTSIEIEVINNPPVANFTINQTIIFEGESVAFTFNGEYGNEPTEFEWDFSDGSINTTLKNPIHQFNYSGIYSVSLMTTDGDDDRSSITMDIEIQNNPPIADFIMNTTTIYEWDIVAFTFIGDYGNGPVNFEWNFGDGTLNSTDENPLHIFEIGGHYNVCCSIVDIDGDFDTISVQLLVHLANSSSNSIYMFFIGIVGAITLLLLIVNTSGIKSKKGKS